LGPRTRDLLGAELAATVEKAAKAEKFKGKHATSLTLVAPRGSDLDRLVVLGVGKIDERAKDLVKIGGVLRGALGKASAATAILEPPGGDFLPAEAAQISQGVRLRDYSFDRYKTKKKSDGDKNDNSEGLSLDLAVVEPAETKKAQRDSDAVAAGTILARDLVNEPPNVLFPAEFAKRCRGLSKLGVDVQVLGEKALKKLGMGALLGVGQGSRRESQVVVMRWNGAKNARGEAARPVAFVGKGVCFDTGGISIKPAQGMEDMKGDMGGAAAVTGLLHALAARKAKVNAVGIVGLVENMPDGNAQRPGDIVTSMSGQTIEIINTDAEGRLVLADILWYAKEKVKPRFMVNLATLTGAVMVALGQEYAGLFSNSDELSERLTDAGKQTGEKVWRLPLSPDYDKMMDSKFADMKNSGGRFAGSITAAQFLQRFVGTTPWAHLDIAGTAMGSPQSEINKSWSSGWGVMLLDRLVRNHYEA
jgi:leucyl aminopeptidase